MSEKVKYSRAFKLDTLNLLQEGKSISEISKNLGISVNTLSTWRRRYQLHGDKPFQNTIDINISKKFCSVLTQAEFYTYTVCGTVSIKKINYFIYIII